MGRSTCYVVCRKDDYENVSDCDGLVRALDTDRLYEWLTGLPEGCEFVDDMDGPCELGPCEWFHDEDGFLKCADFKPDAWEIWWEDQAAKEGWFAKYFGAFREYAHSLGESTLQDFATYKTLDPVYELNTRYNRCWGGRVAVLDENVSLAELDYVMEFLRVMEPGERFAVAKKGWLYK